LRAEYYGFTSRSKIFHLYGDVTSAKRRFLLSNEVCGDIEIPVSNPFFFFIPLLTHWDG
jgi:hypothetical protein